MDPNVISLAQLSMTQALALFQGFLPKFSEIRAKDPASNPDFVTDVRMGELAASLLALGIGGTMAALSQSPVPAAIAVLSCIGLIMLYESALRANSSVKAA